MFHPGLLWNCPTSQWTFEKGFEWTIECQQAFDDLRTCFTSEPVLVMPDQMKPFQIECDMSKICVGGCPNSVRLQWGPTPCAFISKTFSHAERNYEIYDWELLAIIQALEEWGHYIQGSPHTMIVFSNHKNLIYFWEARKLNWQQARWSLYLSEFDIKLVHITGIKIVQLDTLSRRLDFTPEEDTDNENITMLLDALFVNLIDTELQERILNCEKLDSDTMEALKVLLEEGPTTIRNQLPDWTVEHVEGKQVLYYWGKNYIPKDEELRRDIAKMFHDHPTAGHPGELETYNSIWQHYWWLGLRTYVKNYIQGCGICQQFKINRQPTKPSFLPTEGAPTTRPFANCSMDFITDLPPVKGHDSILVVVDQGLTKGIILILCSKMIMTEETAWLLLENLYKHFGLPDKIISDWGPQFALKAFIELLKLLGVKSSVYRLSPPDGQNYQAGQPGNQGIFGNLLCFPSRRVVNSLTLLEFTRNNRRHADRQKTPFELMFGDSPQAIPHSFENTRFPAVEAKMKQLRRNREEALAAHELAQTRMIEQRKSKFTPFQKGEKVWLDSRNLKTLYHKKMALKREGPFEITDVLGPLTYQLKLPEMWRIHNVFHASLLRRYRENDVYGANYDRPLAELNDKGQEVYNIETILKHRKRGRGYQYYVKWEGYPITEASCEPEGSFSNNSDILSQYKQCHQLWTRRPRKLLLCYLWPMI